MTRFKAKRNPWIAAPLRHPSTRTRVSSYASRAMVSPDNRSFEKGMPRTYKKLLTPLGVRSLDAKAGSRAAIQSLCSPFSQVSIVVMYRNLRLSFLAIVVLLCFSLYSGAEAQLNFSTGWGKRSQRVGVAERDAARSAECASQPRPSLEQLLIVYDLIQTEARRVLDCRKLIE